MQYVITMIHIRSRQEPHHTYVTSYMYIEFHDPPTRYMHVLCFGYIIVMQEFSHDLANTDNFTRSKLQSHEMNMTIILCTYTSVHKCIHYMSYAGHHFKKNYNSWPHHTVTSLSDSRNTFNCMPISLELYIQSRHNLTCFR